MKEYIQGGCIEEPIICKDVDGTVIDITTLTELWLRIYHKSNRTEIAERSLGAGTLITVDASAGQVKPLIIETESAAMVTGVWRYELEAKIYDAEWIGNYRYVKTKGDYFILKSTIE